MRIDTYAGGNNVLQAAGPARESGEGASMRFATAARLRALVVIAIALAASSIQPAGGAQLAVAGPSATSPGYWLLGGDGGVFAFGAPFFGSAASDPTRCPANTTDRTLPDGTCQAIAATPDGGGYWILNVDTGRIFPFGNAGTFGEPADGFAGTPREFVPTGRAIVSTPDGQGYWVLEVGLNGAGTIEHFGNAGFFGDTATLQQQQGAPFNGEPVGMAATADGQGYWEVYSDGGVFAFGNAGFYGSTGGVRLNQPIVGMAATADGKGYWLVARDGGVFAFGDAVFAGSTGSLRLNQPIVGLAANPDGTGYWLVASDGGVFAFGAAPFLGSTGGQKLARPVFGIAARPAGP
jgi:hypothetical protein